jgi:hypothetical protein
VRSWLFVEYTVMPECVDEPECDADGGAVIEADADVEVLLPEPDDAGALEDDAART